MFKNYMKQSLNYINLPVLEFIFINIMYNRMYCYFLESFECVSLMIKELNRDNLLDIFKQYLSGYIIGDLYFDSQWSSSIKECLGCFSVQ